MDSHFSRCQLVASPNFYSKQATLFSAVLAFSNLKTSMFAARHTKLITVFLVACTLGLAGCSSQRTVTGEVTLDGKPIDLGALTFEASGKPKLSATIKEGGKYALEHAGKNSVEPGTYKVVIRGYERDTKHKPGSPPNHKVITPKMYASASTSGLTADVKAGSNIFDFELTSTK